MNTEHGTGDVCGMRARRLAIAYETPDVEVVTGSVPTGQVRWA
jgi:hypothetical protein